MSKLNILDGIEVHGNVESNHIYAETYRTSRSDGDIYIQAASASDFVSIGTEGGNNNLLTVLGGGNVGIGTTSPATKLHVEHTGSQIGSTGFYYNTKISDDSNAGLLLGHNNTDNGAGMIAGVNEIAFLTYGTSWGERMRIDRSGNVGIGTNSPQNLLSIRQSDLF